MRVRPVRDRQTGQARLASIALFGAVLAVLLIACANVANLQLARGVARQRELAVRIALGAPRARLVRQSLTESLLIAVCGGAAGIGLAYAMLTAFVAIAPGGLPRLEEATLDPRVLWFAAAASLASSAIFGLWPALRSPAGTAVGGWRTVGISKDRLRPALIAAQIGVSMVLLTAAGLLLRSLWKLERIDTGVRPDHVVTARFVLGSHRYRDAEMLAFFDELERRLAALPGAQAAAIADSLPPRGGYRGRPLSTIAVEGVPRMPEGSGGMVAWRYVTPGYFAALGIPIVRGRGFTAEDRAPNRYSAIVSETLARRLFPGRDAVGGRMLRDAPNDWFTVVGIAADVKNRGPGRPAEPEYYLLRKPVPDVVFRNQEPPTGWRAATAVVRAAAHPRLVASSLRQALAQMDATLPVEIETMRQRMEGIHAGPRFNAFLLALFAFIAVALAALGLFGVMSFLVARRTREFGVRMALGATSGSILLSALGQSVPWVTSGLLAGAAGSAAVGRWMRSLLFQVEPLDPFSLGVPALALALVALAAAAGPARRAARVDPMTALREE